MQNKTFCLNIEFFIAKSIQSGNKKNFSRPIIRIAVASISLGIAVMILAVFIVTGFQKEIRNKVVGFASHIQITRYNENNSLESSPVDREQAFYKQFKSNNDIRHIQVFATKAGIIKTDSDLMGIVLKGVDSDFDWTFFNDKLLRGKVLNLRDTGKLNDILISEVQASKLKIDTGQHILMYFINPGQTVPGVRKFKVCGIYKTGMDEFDKMFVYGDIKHIQKLNNWGSDQVGGFEIYIRDFDRLDEMANYIYNEIDYNLNCSSIKEIYPQIFDWLSFQDINVQIIIIMMLIVSAINMISALLILIIEKTSMIGILKALGMRNSRVRLIFLLNATLLIAKGLIWGNLIAIILSLVQRHWGLIKLDPASYYVSEVPVNIDIFMLLLINLGTIAVCTLVLIVPTFVITRITPCKAIRFK